MALGCAVSLSACARAPTLTQLHDAELVETSGIAATRSGAPGYWAINDGGHGSTLYRLDLDGKTLSRTQVRGARNRDWEDLASFAWRSQNWVLIADIGDNSARRSSTVLHLLAEPAQNQSTVESHASIRVVYPDGARDAEGLAVDPIGETLYILSKRDIPNRLYSLPLAAFDQPQRRHTLKAEGTIEPDASPGPATLLQQLQLLAIGGYSTAFDISADGRHAVVLGYRRARAATRTENQTWSTALQTLQPLADHRLQQAEAVAFSRDGHSVVTTSEGLHAPLLTQQRPGP